MTNYESIDPKDIRTVFQKCFAIDKDTNEVKRCSEVICANCLFFTPGDCKKIKREWLDQPVFDPEKDIDWSKVPADTPVIVWNSEIGANRYFCRKICGECFETFAKGSTSWSSFSTEILCRKEHWPHCKLYRPEDVEKYRKKGTENG